MRVKSHLLFRPSVLHRVFHAQYLHLKQDFTCVTDSFSCVMTSLAPIHIRRARLLMFVGWPSWSVSSLLSLSSSSSTMSEAVFHRHSIITSGSIAGSENHGRGRQTFFSAVVDPMNKMWIDEGETRSDQAQSRCWQADLENKSRCNILGWYFSCEKMGMKFFRAKSNSIIFYDNVPPIRIAKVVFRKSEEVLHTKALKSSRPLPTTTPKGNWQKNYWNSDAIASSSSSQPIQTNQSVNTVQPVAPGSRILCYRFRSFLHKKVVEVEQGRVRYLMNQIKDHFHRDDLHGDLRQDNVHNPFSFRRRWSTTLLTWSFSTYRLGGKDHRNSWCRFFSI